MVMVSIVMRTSNNWKKGKTTQDCVCLPGSIYGNLTFPQCNLDKNKNGFASTCILLDAPCCWGPWKENDCTSGVYGQTMAVCWQSLTNPNKEQWSTVFFVLLAITLITFMMLQAILYKWINN